MSAIVALVLGVFVEVVRRQDRGQYRHFGFQLNLHQAADYCVGDKVVAVDTAIDHQPRTGDRAVAPGFGQQLGLQRAKKFLQEFR